jgi:hypothetical protein
LFLSDAREIGRLRSRIGDADLAREYGFTDIDGRQVEPFELG